MEALARRLLILVCVVGLSAIAGAAERAGANLVDHFAKLERVGETDRLRLDDAALAAAGLEEQPDFIVDAGGIPCYPALLDDKNGKMTGFEGDWDRMDEILQSFNVSCLELIPLRNSLEKLDEFVSLFAQRDCSKF